MMKRLCSAFVVLLLLLTLSPLAVNAAINPNIKGETVTAASVSGGKISPFAFSSSVDVAALKDYLETQFAAFNTTINLKQFKISNTQENINALANLIFCDMPTSFQVESFSYGPSYFSSVYYLYPTYCYDEATYKTMLAEVDAGAERMIADFKNDTNLTDVQKALLAHDRLAEFCVYTLIEDTTSQEFLYTHNIYGATVTGRAVCQGYALAYTYMLEKMNIPSYACVSTELNHVWNIIYVNGNYYHVDVTWDDPLWNTSDWGVTGKVYHNYFLVSTEYLKANNHNTNDYDTTPTDQSYDTYFWQKSETGFQLLNDTIYYIDNKTGSLNTYDGNTLLTVEEKWRASANSVWTVNFSCLATDGNVLFYSAPEVIYAYEPVKNRSYKAYEPDLSVGDYFYVYGMSYAKGAFTIDINNTPNFDNDLMKRVVVEYVFTVPEITGDINDDGILSTNDYILIRMHCNQQCRLEGEMAEKADLNGDGMISSVDYITIQMLIKQ